MASRHPPGRAGADVRGRRRKTEPGHGARATQTPAPRRWPTASMPPCRRRSARCGYPDCRHYAEAIACGEADIDPTAAGGEEGVAAGGADRPCAQVPKPAHGTEGPEGVAVIDETWCIGRTLCIKARLTDAIVGAHKRMHTVIEPYCTGCELCIPACPGLHCDGSHQRRPVRLGRVVAPNRPSRPAPVRVKPGSPAWPVRPTSSRSVACTRPRPSWPTCRPTPSTPTQPHPDRKRALDRGGHRQGHGPRRVLGRAAPATDGAGRQRAKRPG